MREKKGVDYFLEPSKISQDYAKLLQFETSVPTS